MKRAFIALLTFVVATAPCLGANWEFITRSSTGDVIAMDADSVAKKGSHTKAWFTYNYTKEQQSLFGKKYWRTKDLIYFDCAEKTSATIQIIYFDDADMVVTSDFIDYKDARFHDVSPESVGEAQMKAACRKR